MPKSAINMLIPALKDARRHRHHRAARSPRSSTDADRGATATASTARAGRSPFDDAEGYGTVARPSDGAEHFFHCTAIADGTRTIDVGAAVTFEVVPGASVAGRRPTSTAGLSRCVARPRRGRLVAQLRRTPAGAGRGAWRSVGSVLAEAAARAASTTAAMASMASWASSNRAAPGERWMRGQLVEAHATWLAIDLARPGADGQLAPGPRPSRASWPRAWARSSGRGSARSMPAASAASARAASLITGASGRRRLAGRSGSVARLRSVALDGNLAARGPQAHDRSLRSRSEGRAESSSAPAVLVLYAGYNSTEAGFAPTRPPQTRSPSASRSCTGLTDRPRVPVGVGRMSAFRRPPSSHFRTVASPCHATRGPAH